MARCGCDVGALTGAQVGAKVHPGTAMHWPRNRATLIGPEGRGPTGRVFQSSKFKQPPQKSTQAHPLNPKIAAKLIAVSARSTSAEGLKGIPYS